MKKTLKLVGVMVLAIGVAGVAGAQGRRGAKGGGSEAAVDPTSVSTVTGTVASFVAGAGVGMPSLVVTTDNGATQRFVLGPYRLLQAKQLSLTAGDRVEVRALECSTGGERRVAIEVRNLTQGTTVALRSEDGTPLWVGGGGQGQKRFGRTGEGKAGRAASGRGHGKALAACGGAGPDLARSSTYAGPVVRFDGGAGAGQPSLVLATAQGEVAIRLAPYRALVRTSYTPEPGANLEVVAAPVTVDGAEHLVALSLHDVATGLTIQLRGEDGSPVRSPRGPRPRGRG